VRAVHGTDIWLVTSLPRECQRLPVRWQSVARKAPPQPDSAAAGTYYTASEEDVRLFPTQSHQLIAMPAGSALGDRLATIAGTGKLNIKRLGAGDLAAALLLQALPPGWR